MDVATQHRIEDVIVADLRAGHRDEAERKWTYLRREGGDVAPLESLEAVVEARRAGKPSLQQQTATPWDTARIRTEIDAELAAGHWEAARAKFQEVATQELGRRAAALPNTQRPAPPPARVPPWLSWVPGLGATRISVFLPAVLGYAVLLLVLLFGYTGLKLFALLVLLAVYLAGDVWGLRSRIPAFKSGGVRTTGAWSGLSVLAIIALGIGVPATGRTSAAGNAPVNATVAEQPPGLARQQEAVEHLNSAREYQAVGEWGLALEGARQAQALQRDSTEARQFLQTAVPQATTTARQAQAAATAETRQAQAAATAEARQAQAAATAEARQAQAAATAEARAIATAEARAALEAMSPTERLQLLAARDLRDVRQVSVANGVASITYTEGFTWTEGTVVRAVATKFKELAPSVLAIEGIQQFELASVGEFKDVRGNSGEAMAIKFRVTREGAEKVNWSNVAPRNFAKILTGRAGGMEVHPALRQVWRDYEAGK
jgi:hypothetical protein